MAAYLFDTNIWLRAVQRESPHHALAVNALAALLARGDVICLTAQNLIEFWSVASRPSEANGLGWPVTTVRQEIDRLLAQFPLKRHRRSLRTGANLSPTIKSRVDAFTTHGW